MRDPLVTELKYVSAQSHRPKKIAGDVEPVPEGQRIGDYQVTNEGTTAAAGATSSVEAEKVEGKSELAGEQPFDVFSVDALLERMRKMWRDGPGRPVRSDLRTCAGPFTKRPS